ncbi:MAG: type II toxin-antitoxin system prevent-host-death family antitoxin [Bifidobacteriaceae bacterium]|nr:type II toxin-antitoxin system prevent-host-death family antitoxin [Bifidobacteriaceae bacterium]
MDAKTHLSQLVDASRRGEHVVIARRGKPAVKLVPIEHPAPKPTDGVFKWGGGLAEHVDEHLDGFGQC